MSSRVLENATNQITQKYKVLTHKGIDLVKYKSKLCNIIAHTEGKVVFCQTGKKNDPKAKGTESYGNCVKIKHPNGYYTLYAHLATVKVKLNQNVKKGAIIGYMGNTGHSFGGHLHFEVRNKKDVRINPTKYINADLPNMETKHIVKKGDTLTSIASKYNTTIDKIVKDNNIKDPNKISVGQELVIK